MNKNSTKFELHDDPPLPPPIEQYQSHEKRGIREGAMVSQDLSRGKELTTRYTDITDLQTQYPTVIPPTNGEMVINAKGDWNKNPAFRPDFIKITFNIKLEDIPSGWGSPGGGNG
jgi:hypothetical protein